MIREAYAEVYTILGLMEDQYVNKLPATLVEFFNSEKDEEYEVNIDTHKPLNEQNLKEKTLAILAMLNLKYWCDNEIERRKLTQVYEENERKYQEVMNENFRASDPFKKNIENTNLKNNVNKKSDIVKYEKESFFKRLINKLFNRKKKN